MRPPDAVDGWDDPRNADLYDRFTRAFPFYAQTSRDLAVRAAVDHSGLVIDLCGGTGVTAAAILAIMAPPGRVISVDSSRAMQAAGQRSRPDPRITWRTCRAEDITVAADGPADAVVCNAAIWKTDTPAVFAAVRHVLRPGGRFVFNIGGGFAGLPQASSQQPARAPSLTDLIEAIAARDFGHVPRPPQATGVILTAGVVRRQLADAGFTVLAQDIVTHQGTVEEKHAWLSIPLFARPPGPLTHAQRLDILSRAYQQADKTRPTTTRWLVVTAQA
jgi:SAM-dependent methyltransferase